MLSTEECEEYRPHIWKSLLQHTDIVNARKLHPQQQIPNVSEYLPSNSDFRNIVAFNNCQTLPKLLRPSLSDLVSTSHEKNVSIVKWLMDTKALNPTTLAYFYARPENSAVLEGVLDVTYHLNGDSFVEFFRSYLTATGCMSLSLSLGVGVDDQSTSSADNGNDNDKQHHHHEDQPPHQRDMTSNNNASILNYHLSFFSKYYISHDVTCRNSANTDTDTWEQVRALCHSLLSLSQAMHTPQHHHHQLQQQSQGSLPDFFSAVRLFAKTNYALFAPRSLTLMFNTIKANGPFSAPPAPDASTPPFLFSLSQNSRHCSIRVSLAMNDINDSLVSRRVILTSNAMYTFEDRAELQGGAATDAGSRVVASRGIGRCLECVPLKYVRVKESELEYMSIELLPREDDKLIPYFNILQQSHGDGEDEGGEGGEEGEEGGEEVSLMHCSCLFLKVRSHLDHDSLRAQLEEAVWGTKQQLQHKPLRLS